MASGTKRQEARNHPGIKHPPTAPLVHAKPCAGTEEPQEARLIVEITSPILQEILRVVQSGPGPISSWVPLASSRLHHSPWPSRERSPGDSGHLSSSVSWAKGRPDSGSEEEGKSYPNSAFPNRLRKDRTVGRSPDHTARGPIGSGPGSKHRNTQTNAGAPGLSFTSPRRSSR